MEVLDVKLIGQTGLRLGPQLPDLELTDLVAGGLTRPGHVSVNLNNGQLQRC